MIQKVISMCVIVSVDGPLSAINVEKNWLACVEFAREFRQRATALYNLLKYRAKRGEMAELFVFMTFNTYYSESSLKTN